VTDKFIYRVKVFSLIIFLWLSFFNHRFSLFAGTVNDIRSKLKVKKGAVPTNTKIHKEIFDIKNIRKIKISGWKVKDDKGRKEGLHGVTITFKINKKGDYIDMPYAVCYFYDKNKNLIDRVKANFIYSGKWHELDTEHVLQFKGKKNIKIAFSQVASLKFKYGVCVIGNMTKVSAAIIPKSADINDFDFDEKTLLET